MNKEKFDLLLKHKEKIEKSLGDLSWERLDDRKACRIALYKYYTNDDEIISWGIDKLKAFRLCFKEFLL